MKLDAKCTLCNEDLVIKGCYSYFDCGIADDGDGIISYNSCPNDNCEVDQIIIYQNPK